MPPVQRYHSPLVPAANSLYRKSETGSASPRTARAISTTWSG